ncbi:MAG: phenylalanine--tRNA ligase subunit beta [Nitrososphaerales archaeon]
MPVVTLYFDRILKMLEGKVGREELINKLPHLALDLEEIQEDHIKVEYNPNRPDFSTDYGLARALKGIFDLELGAPKYDIQDGNVKVMVEDSVKSIRPYIVGLIAKDLRLDEESIRQLISMQEDLHHGLGRDRRVISIGLHNLDVIKPPFIYKAVEPSFSFIPLNENRCMSLRDILINTEVGLKYGKIIKDFEKYPLLVDSNNNVLSFPPIINGELTRVDINTKNLFLDITALELKAALRALSIIASVLIDMGAKVERIEVDYRDKKILTPDMKSLLMKIDFRLINKLLGLKLDKDEIFRCLRRCRLNVVKKGNAFYAEVPPYRVDIIHPVDIVEEVVIGLDLERIKPTLPEGANVGKRDERSSLLDDFRMALISQNFVEVMNFSLLSKKLLYEMVNREFSDGIKVEDPKSSEHEYLRDTLIPCLLQVLSNNTHAEYPQRIFEIGKVFLRNSNEEPVREEYRIVVAIAYSEANYSEAKSSLSSLLYNTFGLDFETKPSFHPTFSYGRCASIRVDNEDIGVIGEIDPLVLENFGLKVPVSLYEFSYDKLEKKFKARR